MMSLKSLRSRRISTIFFLLALAAFLCASAASRQAAASRPAVSSQQQPQDTRGTPTSARPQASPTPLPDADEEVVRVETDLASILMTAVDRDNRFITTLKREDVRVLENGVPQELSIFQRETDRPLSLAILIDTSRSQERTLPDEKTAARTFVDSVIRPAKDNVAVVSFTGEPKTEHPLTNNLARLHAAINGINIGLPPDNPECRDDVGTVPIEQESRCWTAIWDSIWDTIAGVLSRTPDHTRRAIILLSDGDDTRSEVRRDSVIDFAIKSDTVIYAIGIGDRERYEVDDGALRKISERTGGRAFFPLNRAQLNSAFEQIESELRSQYLVGYTPSNRKRDGSFRQVKMEIVNPELRKQKLRLLYRQGYYAKSR